jgi:hypothetical protein
MADLSILDQSIPAIGKVVPALNRDDALALLGAEQIGKTRKGVVSLLQEHIATFGDEPVVEGADVAEAETAPAAEPASDEPADIPAGMVEIENIIEGSALHLGDTRKLAFGERAIVGASLAETLREREQAR